MPEPGWLDAYLEAFRLHPRVGAAYGPHLPFPDTSPMIARELTEFFAGFSPDGEPVAAASRRPDLPVERERLLRAQLLGGAALPRRGLRRGSGLRARACSRRAGSRPTTRARPFCTRTTTGRSSSCSATSTSTAGCARRAVTWSRCSRWRRHARFAPTRAGCAPSGWPVRAARCAGRRARRSTRAAGGSPRRSARAPSGCRTGSSARSRSRAAAPRRRPPAAGACRRSASCRVAATWPRYARPAALRATSCA